MQNNKIKKSHKKIKKKNESTQVNSTSPSLATSDRDKKKINFQKKDLAKKTKS